MPIYGPSRDPDARISQAENEVLLTYGQSVSVRRKGKSLNKFGRNLAVGSTEFETVAEFQGTVANETYASTNSVYQVASSSVNDTQTITVEGHIIDGLGNLTFSTQQVTLNGQTPVDLGTSVARVGRAFISNSGTFNAPQSTPEGTIYIFDGVDGVTAGVPNTPAATKVIISAGENQSEKAATSISKDDFWFITTFAASIGNTGGSAQRIVVRMEKRDVFNGGVWRPMGQSITLFADNDSPPIPLDPFLIVPSNHDWRIRAKTNANVAEVYASANGLLAT